MTSPTNWLPHWRQSCKDMAGGWNASAEHKRPGQKDAGRWANGNINRGEKLTARQPIIRERGTVRDGDTRKDKESGFELVRMCVRLIVLSPPCLSVTTPHENLSQTSSMNPLSQSQRVAVHPAHTLDPRSGKRQPHKVRRLRTCISANTQTLPKEGPRSYFLNFCFMFRRTSPSSDWLFEC